jgi:hypothetical protein
VPAIEGKLAKIYGGKPLGLVSFGAESGRWNPVISLVFAGENPARVAGVRGGTTAGAIGRNRREDCVVHRLLLRLRAVGVVSGRVIPTMIPNWGLECRIHKDFAICGIAHTCVLHIAVM